MKQLFLDLETTGVELAKNGVWQIAGHIVIDDVLQESFDLRCQPLPGQLIAAKAMEVNGMSVDKLRELPLPGPVFADFKQMLGKYVNKWKKQDKFVLIGYNARFDSDFLRQWFTNLGDTFYGSWFWHPPVDIMQLAMFVLHEKRHELADFKQPTVAEYLGIKFEGDAHDAAADIDVTRKLYNYFVDKYLKRTQERPAFDILQEQYAV